MSSTKNRTINSTTVFCSHPFEGLRTIRRLSKMGEPLPQIILINDPQSEQLLKNMVMKMKKLTGQENCPTLVII